MVVSYSNRKMYVLELEFFVIVYIKLMCHTSLIDNDSGTVHDMFPFPDLQRHIYHDDISFIIRDLGDEPGMWINRFIAEVIKAAEKRKKHGNWARENEYVTLVVDDLKEQLFNTKSYVTLGFPKHAYYLNFKLTLVHNLQ